MFSKKTNKNRKFKLFFGSKRGDISVLMILSILLSMLMIGTATATITFKSLDSSRTSNDAAEAFYIAEASLERKLVELKYNYGADALGRQCIVDCASYYIINKKVYDRSENAGASINLDGGCHCQNDPYSGETSYFGETGRDEHFKWKIMGSGAVANVNGKLVVKDAKVRPVIRVDGGNYRVSRGIKATLALPKRCAPMDVILMVSSDLTALNESVGSPINLAGQNPIFREPMGATYDKNDPESAETILQAIDGLANKIIDNFNFGLNKLVVVQQYGWNTVSCIGADGKKESHCRYVGVDPDTFLDSQGNDDGRIENLKDYWNQGPIKTQASVQQYMNGIIASNENRQKDEYEQDVRRVIIKIDDGKLSRLPANMSTQNSTPSGCQVNSFYGPDWAQFVANSGINGSPVEVYWVKVASEGNINTSCHASVVVKNWYGSDSYYDPTTGTSYPAVSTITQGTGGIIEYDRCQDKNETCDSWTSPTETLSEVYNLIENSLNKGCSN